MKTRYTLLTLGIIALSACTFSEEPKVTEAGTIATRTVINAIDAQMKAVNMALNLAEYLDAEESKKPVIQNVYLDGNTPNDLGNGNYVLRGTPYTFYTNNQSIWDAGSTWTILMQQEVQSYLYSTPYPHNVYTSVLATITMTCVERNKWTITSSKVFANGAFSSSVLLFTANAGTIKGQPFAATLSGDGKAISHEPEFHSLKLNIDYTIEESNEFILGTGFYYTQQYNERLIAPEGGKLQMKCTQEASTPNDPDIVTATFSLSSTRIDFNGVIETWPGLLR